MKIFNFATASPVKPKWEKTPDGFLRCKARLLAERIMLYNRAELEMFSYPDEFVNMVVKSVEINNPESLRSLEGIPLVAGDHTWLSPDIARQYAVGAVAGAPVFEDGYLVSDLLITDPDTIKQIEENKLGEISAAYSADTVFEPGTLNGQPYDAEQTALRYNHIAILPPGMGRAGMDVRILNKGVNHMSQHYENGRKKAEAEIEEMIRKHNKERFGAPEGSINFVNSQQTVHYTDPQTAAQKNLQRVLNCRRPSSIPGTPHHTPTEIRQMMMNAAGSADVTFSRKVQRAEVLHRMGFMNAGEAMEQMAKAEEESRMRQLRRGERHAITAAEALTEGYEKYKNRRPLTRNEVLSKMGFKMT